MDAYDSEHVGASPTHVRFVADTTAAGPQDCYSGQTLFPPRTVTSPTAATSSSLLLSPQGSPRSPLLRKFAPVQDRRVNTILLEALQLVEFTKDELVVVERAVKRLRDAIHGFAILVDKQVNIIGTESLEERGRVKADILDLCENLKTSNALLDSTCMRMKKHLQLGKNQVHAHKRKLVGKAAAELLDAAAENEARGGRLCNMSDTAALPQTNDGSRDSRTLFGLSVPHTPQQRTTAAAATGSPLRLPPTCSTSCSSPNRAASRDAHTVPPSSPVSRLHSPSKVPLARILDTSAAISNEHVRQQPPQVYLSPDCFTSVSDAVGIREKEFLEPKDIMRFVHELLTFSIARSGVLTFSGKAHHRQLIPKYVHELVRQILVELQPPSHTLTIKTTSVVPQDTLFDYMCAEPFRFHHLLHGLYVANTNLSDGTSFFTAAAAAANPIDVRTDVNANAFAEQPSRNSRTAMHLAKPAAESELLESAEQTLTIAKLLHDLATAESEAKHGSRMSVRSPASRSKEFSKAYLATSKELMLKESGLG